MKRLILIWILIVIANFCFSQTEKSILIDTSKSGINPLILLSFDKVKSKKLYIPEVKFFTIYEYQKIFSLNLHSYRQRSDLLFLTNSIISFNRDFFNKPTSFSYEKYSRFNKRDDFYCDYNTPEEALIFGSLNFIIYMFSNE